MCCGRLQLIQGPQATRPTARHHLPCVSNQIARFISLHNSFTVEKTTQVTSCEAGSTTTVALQQVTYTFGTATRARLSMHLPAAPNQDAFLTFPTFLAAEQALVGVMDGHGPQGEPGAWSRLTGLTMLSQARISFTVSPPALQARQYKHWTEYMVLTGWTTLTTLM